MWRITGHRMYEYWEGTENSDGGEEWRHILGIPVIQVSRSYDSLRHVIIDRLHYAVIQQTLYSMDCQTSTHTWQNGLLWAIQLTVVHVI